MRSTQAAGRESSSCTAFGVRRFVWCALLHEPAHLPLPLSEKRALVCSGCARPLHSSVSVAALEAATSRRCLPPRQGLWPTRCRLRRVSHSRPSRLAPVYRRTRRLSEPRLPRCRLAPNPRISLRRRRRAGRKQRSPHSARTPSEQRRLSSAVSYRSAAPAPTCVSVTAHPQRPDRPPCTLAFPRPPPRALRSTAPCSSSSSSRASSPRPTRRTSQPPPPPLRPSTPRSTAGPLPRRPGCVMGDVIGTACAAPAACGATRRGPRTQCYREGTRFVE